MVLDKDVVADVMEDFSHDELKEIAEELGLRSSYKPETLIKKISKHVEDKGIAEDCSELLEELVYVLGYDIEDEEESEEEIEKIPECYTFADDRDPACRKCKLFAECKVEREKNRPPCFGKLYDPDHPECQICIENQFCRIKMDND